MQWLISQQQQQQKERKMPEKSSAYFFPLQNTPNMSRNVVFGILSFASVEQTRKSAAQVDSTSASQLYGPCESRLPIFIANCSHLQSQEVVVKAKKMLKSGKRKDQAGLTYFTGWVGSGLYKTISILISFNFQLLSINPSFCSPWARPLPPPPPF